MATTSDHAPSGPPLERRGPRTLPRQGTLYFNHLCAEYFLLGDDALERGHKARLEEVLAKKQRGERLSWDDLYLFDLALCKTLPEERLSAKLGALRARYRDVVGPRQFEAYMASDPPALTSSDPSALRSEIELLLGELYFRYAIHPLREEQREAVAGTAVITLGACLGAVVLACVAVAAISGSIAALVPVAVMLAGCIGGAISMLQRYKEWSSDGDPIHNVAQLRRDLQTTVLPALSGAAFSLVLFLIFASGLLSGKLFPNVSVLIPSPAGPSTEHLLMLVTTPVFAQVMIASFMAGFAERLVPETLSRLAERAQPTSQI